ncbi:O-antigen ligase family protein [Chlamydiota bacterium]
MRFRRKRIDLTLLETFLDKICIICLFLFFFLRPLISGIVYPNSNIRFFILILVVFFVMVVQKICTERISFRWNWFTIINSLFCLVLVISSVLSVNKYASIEYSMHFIGYFLLYLIASNIEISLARLRILLLPVVLSTLIVSLFGIHQWLFGLGDVRSWVNLYLNSDGLPPAFKARLASSRIFSTFVYPNALGGFLIVVLPIVIASYVSILKRKTSQRNILFLIVFIALIACSVLLVEPYMVGIGFISCFIFPLLPIITLFLSMSKGALFSFIIAVVVNLFFLPPTNKKVFSKYIVFLLVIFISIGCIFLLLVKNKAELKGGLKTMDVRVHYWMGALNIIKEWPVWGTGPGTFGSIYGKYKMETAGETRMVHNNYLQVAAEVGIPACLLFIGMWASLLFSGIIRLRRNKIRDEYTIISFALVTSITAFMIHSFFDFDLYIPGIAACLWFFAGLFTQVSDNYKEIRILFSGSIKKILVILITWLLVGGAILLSKQYIEASSYKKCAKISLQQKNLSLARKQLEAAVKRVRSDYESFYLLGVIATQERRYQDALGYQKKAVALNEYSAFMQYQLALAYSRYLKGPEVDEYLLYHYKKAIECYPTKSFYRLELAAYYELTGRFRDAYDEYFKALRCGDDSAVLLKKLQEIKKNIKSK